jgi:alkylation response protein AidB-like acyl-CoA dehydrogenase
VVGEAALREEVRDWLAQELPADHRTSLGMAGGHDPSFSRRLAARGWIGISIPEALGGRGGSAVERFVVTEELLAAQAPVGAHWIADRQIAPALVAHGAEHQQRDLLPRIIKGECFISIGMSEPESGSDLASVRTRAVRLDGGWSVAGTKVWTTFAHLNHYIVVLCRTSAQEGDRHAGLSQLIVDLASPGVTVTPIRTMDGQQEFCEVHLDNVFVPDTMLLGMEGRGWEQVTSELSLERYGPERWLSVWALVEAAVDLLRNVDDPLGRELVGRLVARYRVVRQISLDVARRVDEGAFPVAEAAIAKDLATVLEQDTVEVFRRICGTEADPTSGARRDRIYAQAILTSPTFTLRGGTTEILRTLISRAVTA